MIFSELENMQDVYSTVIHSSAQYGIQSKERRRVAERGAVKKEESSSRGRSSKERRRVAERGAVKRGESSRSPE